MKLVRFRAQANQCFVGVLTGKQVFPLTGWSTTTDLIEAAAHARISLVHHVLLLVLSTVAVVRARGDEQEVLEIVMPFGSIVKMAFASS